MFSARAGWIEHEEFSLILELRLRLSLGKCEQDDTGYIRRGWEQWTGDREGFKFWQQNAPQILPSFSTFLWDRVLPLLQQPGSFLMLLLWGLLFFECSAKAGPGSYQR